MYGLNIPNYVHTLTRRFRTNFANISCKCRLQQVAFAIPGLIVKDCRPSSDWLGGYPLATTFWKSAYIYIHTYIRTYVHTYIHTYISYISYISYIFILFSIFLSIKKCVSTHVCLYMYIHIVYNYNRSTAQGGGGSFNNRKPVGEVGCCDSRMAGRIH